ncbi:TetR/AcrR family transcriptional regulator [Stutzerimonas nitrititolerans]|uniref:TetR/AcrR family transcriptional regulator n=1 Tax=Stutzerimonas nitrititolerans TaxID=2482751 RepID=UPI001BD4286E|nr:TetR/AcrR family transcriptional regulator [Stutzerimonas nitrititolerans]
MRYTPQHKAETRARLLRSAARAAKCSGLAAASVDGIAADAGISGGGVYHHFASKQELFAAAIVQDLESSLLMRLTRSPELTAEQLQQGLSRYLSVEHAENVEGGCPVPPLCADLSRGDSAVRLGFEAWITELHQTWSVVLGSSPLAWGAICQSIGALLIARALESQDTREEVLSENLADLSCRL